jgi:exo-1,4-beta-D-glucosaminidase
VADYRTPEGHRGFKVNGREVLIKGAGWTDDLLLADTPQTIATELQYVRHLNLNCIRCENIWGKDATLYDLCDEYGILMMVGWSCQWEHEQYLGKPVDERYGGVLSFEDIELVSQSWQDQLLWLRNHPSIFVWAVASDKLPAPPLERRYIGIFRQYDPTRPYLVSTGGMGSEQRIVCREELVSEVSGSSGVKMLGPYEYTPPVYWYTDTRRGGAYGFNTETSPGAVVPTLESIQKMIPPDHLWPVDSYWDFHCGLNEFNKLDRYREALARRYGPARSVEEFARKAQVLNYELMRPMFEAFRVHRGRATGVIQWMLNAAWPKMYWQLYDWYLMPTGAFYGAKKACEPQQLIYHYGDNAIYLVTDPHLVGWAMPTIPGPRSRETVGNAHPTGLTADIRVYDIESRLFLAAHFRVDAERTTSKRVFKLPRLENVTTTYFLSLRLLEASGALVANNFYWLSTTPDVLDHEAKVTPWEYYTPSKQYADLTMLNALPSAEVSAYCHIEAADGRNVATVTLENHSDRIAFFIELLLVAGETGEPVVPVFWQDNFVSLLAHETRVLTATFPAGGQAPNLTLRGWNVR